MRRTWLLLALVLLLLPAVTGRVFARQANPSATPAAAGNISISAPRSGEALQGTVRIITSAGGENFQSAEIAFAYAGDTSGTWFLILESSQPFSAETPVEWDTSLITDGDYTLRLQVTYTDGSRQTEQVTGLRVRNYTAVETRAPVPAAATTTAPTPEAGAATAAVTQAAAQPTGPPVTPAVPSATPASTQPPAPTATSQALPNPAALPTGLIWLSAARGALAVLGMFALVGLYDLARRIAKR